MLRAELPTDEAGVIAWFEEAGARVSKNEEGHAVKIFSGGKPPHSSEELQMIGKLVHLEQIALNSPQASNEEWGFLQQLPQLKNLTIWHCKTIQSLEPFSDLPIESLTVGGCMGLRDLNKESPESQRDAVLTLTALPNLRSVNLYHSPTLSNDEHIHHLTTRFPGLTEVKIDVAAPRGFETSVTPAGLASFQKLPVEVLSIENASRFTEAHIEAIAGIKTLEALLLDCRKNAFDTTPLTEAMKKLRPEVEVVVAKEGDPGPPRRSKKG
jgi:hypothetical protein